MEEDVDADLADIEALNFDDLDTLSKLQKTQRYNDIMQVIILSIYIYFYCCLPAYLLLWLNGINFWSVHSMHGFIGS